MTIVQLCKCYIGKGYVENIIIKDKYHLGNKEAKTSRNGNTMVHTIIKSW